jgi:hypothetical protein
MPVIAPIVTMTAWSERKRPAATANLRTENLFTIASINIRISTTTLAGLIYVNGTYAGCNNMTSSFENV